MEADAETHSQTSGGTRVVLCKSGEIEVSKSEGSRTPQENPQSQLRRNHGGSPSLGHQPESMQELDLDNLHIRSKCAA